MTNARDRRFRVVDKSANQLQRLVKNIEREQDLGHDLWTWLPSYQSAKKSHGDSADEYQPTAADIMQEACMMMSVVTGYTPEDHGKMFHYAEWFGCPCGNCDHDTIDRVDLEKMIKFMQRYVKAHGIVMALAMWNNAGRVDKDELELHCGMASAYKKRIDEHDNDG